MEWLNLGGDEQPTRPRSWVGRCLLHITNNLYRGRQHANRQATDRRLGRDSVVSRQRPIAAEHHRRRTLRRELHHHQRLRGGGPARARRLLPISRATPGRGPDVAGRSTSHRRWRIRAVARTSPSRAGTAMLVRSGDHQSRRALTRGREMAVCWRGRVPCDHDRDRQRSRLARERLATKSRRAPYARSRDPSCPIPVAIGRALASWGRDSCESRTAASVIGLARPLWCLAVGAKPG